MTLVMVSPKKNSELRIQSSFPPFSSSRLVFLDLEPGVWEGAPQWVRTEPGRQTFLVHFELKLMPHADVVFVRLWFSWDEMSEHLVSKRVDTVNQFCPSLLVRGSWTEHKFVFRCHWQITCTHTDNRLDNQVVRYVFCE